MDRDTSDTAWESIAEILGLHNDAAHAPLSSAAMTYAVRTTTFNRQAFLNIGSVTRIYMSQTGTGF